MTRALGDPWAQTFAFLAVLSGALLAYARLSPSAAGATGLGPVTSTSAAQASAGARRVLVDARLARDADTADLAAGLAQAKSGDTVYVRAGVYRGSFHPADGVRIVGLGAPASVVIEAGQEGKPALWGSRGLRVDSLTIRAGTPGLFVGRGMSVALDSVSFETGFKAVVAIGAGAKVSLTGCRVQRMESDGVEGREGAALELTRTTVLGSKGCGLELSQASAVLRGSTLSLNDYGVCADAASALDAGDSDLNGNLRGPKGAL